MARGARSVAGTLLLFCAPLETRTLSWLQMHANNERLACLKSGGVFYIHGCHVLHVPLDNLFVADNRFLPGSIFFRRLLFLPKISDEKMIRWLRLIFCCGRV